MPTQPTLAIFRIPEDDDGVIQFVQLELDTTGRPADMGRVFTVGEESSYCDLTYAHIVLAIAVEDGSEDLAWYLIRDSDEPAIVHEMEGEALMTAIESLVQDYMNVGSVTLH